MTTRQHMPPFAFYLRPRLLRLDYSSLHISPLSFPPLAARYAFHPVTLFHRLLFRIPPFSTLDGLIHPCGSCGSEGRALAPFHPSLPPSDALPTQPNAANAEWSRARESVTEVVATIYRRPAAVAIAAAAALDQHPLVGWPTPRQLRTVPSDYLCDCRVPPEGN